MSTPVAVLLFLLNYDLIKSPPVRNWLKRKQLYLQMIKSNVLASAKGELFSFYSFTQDSRDNSTDSDSSTGKIVGAKYDYYLL